MKFTDLKQLIDIQMRINKCSISYTFGDDIRSGCGCSGGATNCNGNFR